MAAQARRGDIQLAGIFGVMVVFWLVVSKPGQSRLANCRFLHGIVRVASALLRQASWVYEFEMPQAILIVDDEVLMQRRLCGVLGRLGHAADALHCADGVAQARELAQANDFSLALVDIGLGDGSGIDLVRWLRQRDDALPILVISQWNTERTIVDALRAGATGYVLKGRDDLEIEVCLRSALAGGAPIDPFIARHILAQFYTPERAEPAQARDADLMTVPVLSEREVQILMLVTKGLTNREIGEVLEISRRTVEGHVNQIYRKLAVHSRTEAVFEARAQGLVT